MNSRHAGITLSRASGFTLIELMVVIAVVSVLAIIAVPGYNNYVTKTKRSVAKAKLLDASSRMELYFLNNKSYDTNDMTALGYASDPLHVNNEGASVEAASSIYQLDVKAANAASYTLAAVPQNGQAVDFQCAELTINSLGDKASTDGDDNQTDCW